MKAGHATKQLPALAGNGRKKWSSDRRTLTIMGLLCFAFVAVFAYLPLFGWIMAFIEYKPGLSFFECDFVGLKYFKMALMEPELLNVLRNTLVMSLLGLLLSPLPVIFAIFLSEARSSKFKKFIQTTTTLPNFIGWVLVYSICFAMFSVGDGVVNKILLQLGWIQEPLNPLANSKVVWFFQTAIGQWKGLGFSAIVYFAAITGVDHELYDAASIAGCGRLKRIWYITVPSIMPTFLTLFVINIGNILNNGFEQFYLFYNPLVHDTIQVLDLYTYRLGINLGDYSFATAIGMFKTVVSVTLLFIVNMLAKKIQGRSVI